LIAGLKCHDFNSQGRERHQRLWHRELHRRCISAADGSWRFAPARDFSTPSSKRGLVPRFLLSGDSKALALAFPHTNLVW